MIRTFLDWLGSAKRENDRITDDAILIDLLGDLLAISREQLAVSRSETARAMQGSAAWRAKHDALKAEMEGKA